jgi:hypothetical protein
VKFPADKKRDRRGKLRPNQGEFCDIGKTFAAVGSGRGTNINLVKRERSKVYSSYKIPTDFSI